MKKTVRVTITGEQSGFGQKDISEIITTGEYYLKNEKHYLFYTERTEDGFVIKNRLIISPEYVELKKTGNGDSLLMFREGHTERCRYQSPAGMMELTSATKKISLKQKEKEWILTLDYSFSMNGIWMSDYHLTVKTRFL